MNVKTTPLRKAKRKGAPTPAPKKEPKISHLHRPREMQLDEWQVALRRQFGREQAFDYANLSSAPVFSDFQVTNPTTGGAYRVAIRGENLGDSYCSCPDFATNTLGTCKHIEFILQKIRGSKSNAATLRRGYEPAYSSVYLRYGAQREVRFHPAKDCPAALRNLAAEYFSADGRLKDDAFGRFDEFLSRAAKIDHELRCYDDVLRCVAERRDRAHREARLGKLFPKGPASPAFDKLLKVPLYPYQREGALFAARAGRTIIGDEMGLGKTIQAIAAVEIMAQHFGVERVLIICPTSLKHQWKKEIEKFAERSVDVIGGLRPRRADHYASESFYKVTNYDTVRRDLDLIEQWAPDLVILDEAQRIKNWNAKVARSVKRINSTYAIVLTGTPLENRLEDLISIVQFVDQHRLGPTFQFLENHQIREPETGKVTGYQKLDAIGRTLAPILIRRKKAVVARELPARLDKNFFVPMTPQQQEMHDENQEGVARIVAKWRRFKFLSEADRLRLMVFLQNMRMSCDSTYLLDQKSDFGFKADELAAVLHDVFEQPDAKVVVFSQWLRMHELLIRRIEDRGWQHVLFHGGVPGDKRGGLVDRFRTDDKCRAFLATDAGGVGLNLQHAASVVINVDLPWNPAVLEQRIGRVHRLGQTQSVQVINFVAQGTIEQGMLSVLKFKTSLFSGVLDSGEPDVFFGGSRLNKFMETVEKTTAGIPATIDTTDDIATTAQDEPDETVAPNHAPTEGIGSSNSEPSAADVAAPTTAPAAAILPTGNDAQGAGADVLGGLMQMGLTLLEQFAKQSKGGQRESASPRTKIEAPAVHRDAKTGESYMKIPMPSPEVLDRALSAIGQLLEQYRGRNR